VFTTNGFYETRVDDIVALAETSHGTFYRYFENKEAMFRILAARSGRRVVASVDDLVALVSPDGAVIDRELRAWLRRYFSVYATEGPILRAWMEATWSDVDLRAASPAEVEGLRRRLASVLAPRGFGDVDADAVALMAMLDRSQPGFEGVLPDERVALDAFTRVMQTSFLAEA
jgi:AcrR family transcriptional regulator